MRSIRRRIELSVGVAVLGCILAPSVGGKETLPSGVRVELDGQKPLSLHITVSSRADERVTFPKYKLPWGNKNSIILVPVNSDGQCVGNELVPIDDSGYEKVSLDPKASISGDIDLRRFIPELEKTLKKSDVHLFWAYAPPAELQIGRWAGGWLLIPKER